MAAKRRGRPTVDPRDRLQKVVPKYASIPTWAYDELINEARRTEEGSMRGEIETALIDRAKKLEKARLARERRGK